VPPRTPYTAVKNVRLLPETLAYLDALAERHGTTSSDLIRRAVDYWLQRRADVPRERHRERLWVTDQADDQETIDLLL
jgi:hypothetical protein